MPLGGFLRGRVDTAPHLHFRFAQRCSNRVAVHEIQEARDPAPGAEICQLRDRSLLTPQRLPVPAHWTKVLGLYRKRSGKMSLSEGASLGRWSVFDRAT